MSMTRSYDGLGIGLASLKAVIDRHDGDVSFKPNRPTGTIVTVTLPIKEHDLSENSAVNNAHLFNPKRQQV